MAVACASDGMACFEDYPESHYQAFEFREYPMKRLSLLNDKLTYCLFRMFIFWPGFLMTLAILLVLILMVVHGVLDGPEGATEFGIQYVQNIDRILAEWPYGSIIFAVCTGVVADFTILLLEIVKWYRQWYLHRYRTFYAGHELSAVEKGQSYQRNS